MAFTYNCDIPA